MKSKALLIGCLLLVQLLWAQQDDWNDRTITSCDCVKGEEVARRSLTFVPGFTTEACNDFVAYIDPDLPLNGGETVSDGEFDMNYIRIFKPIGNTLSDEIPVHNEIDYNNWSEVITYFDGLGRSIQTIDVKASAYGNDIVKSVAYDSAGRLKEEYLAYAIAQDHSTNGPGGYRSDHLTEQRTFFGNYYDSQDANKAYNDKQFDGSPLNRITRQSAPGHTWNIDDGHYIALDYGSNTDTEVSLFEVSQNQLERNGHYSAGSLFKNTTIDENGNELFEYTDFQGRVVMKKGEENTRTYYVYDDLGLLRYVIPPLAAPVLEAMTGSIGDYQHQNIEQLCYYYQYDMHGRMSHKKLPGTEIIYMIYDENDQLILTQDGNKRTDDQWVFTKYDIYKRPVMTGMHTFGGVSSQENMQEYVNQLSNNQGYETFDGGSATAYSNNAYPGIDSGDEIYSLNYYDNYDARALYTNTIYNFRPGELNFIHLQGNEYSTHLKGLPTMSWTKVLLSNGETVVDDELVSISYYDKYNNLVQTISDHHLGGFNVNSRKVNYAGEILHSKDYHHNGGLNLVTSSIYHYNHTRQITKEEHYTAGQNWITMYENKFDEQGLLKQKKLHDDGNGFVQKIDHQYNIRGWLTEINNIDNLNGDLFAIKLDYNMANDPQFNGNIGAISWISEHFNELKKYEFEYDGLNRLLEANDVNNHLYSTSYGYDANGNIFLINRNKDVNGVATAIDQVVCEYDGNQLKNANDAFGNYLENYGFKDNGSHQAIEYNYDANGNMVKDLNKGILFVDYNYMNLPFYIGIDQNQSKKIHYIYTADGVKLRKRVVNNGVEQNKTDYIGAFVYEEDTLQFIQTAEGRLIPSADMNSYSYEYAIKDHLGNIRVMFNESGEVLQDQSYYPFGMSMGEELTFNNSNNSPENKYLYNGKELQMDFDLDWYDYGARFYDPAIARWHVVDPKSEYNRAWSVYKYGKNNPIRFIDPDGMIEWDKILGHVQQAREEGAKIFTGSASASARYYGVGAGVKLGPIKAKAEVNVVEGKGEIKDNGNLKLTGTAASGELKLGFGGAKAEGKVEVLKGEAEIPLTSTKPIDVDGQVLSGNGKVESGPISLDNSLNVGASGKLGPVEVEGNMNLYHLGTMVGHLIDAGAEYIKETVDDIVNPQDNIPELNKNK